MNPPRVGAAFVGRQPIYDRRIRLTAYELLFRDSAHATTARISDLEDAWAETVVTAFVDIGLDRLVGEHRAFINFTRRAILGRYSEMFPKDRIVVEILEGVDPHPDVVAVVRDLAARGYSIALDDFVYREELRPLIEVAKIVKIDVLALDWGAVEEQLEKLRDYPVQLLAEKVETHEVFDRCKQLGFELFQGYFFCKPRVIEGHRLPANRLSALRLLAQLQDPDVELQDLEKISSEDVSISYKLLKYVNSAFFSRPINVDSVRQALVLLGAKNVRNWVSILVMSSVDDHLEELIKLAMMRARMCEILGKTVDDAHSDAFFTVGLFSTLDALMGRPMSNVLDELPLSKPVIAALLKHQGSMGAVLRAVLAYERGDWDSVKESGFPNPVLVSAYLEAVAWAEAASEALT